MVPAFVTVPPEFRTTPALVALVPAIVPELTTVPALPVM